MDSNFQGMCLSSLVQYPNIPLEDDLYQQLEKNYCDNFETMDDMRKVIVDGKDGTTESLPVRRGSASGARSSG